jgi:DNA-binding CsgD family transcriptional regulator
MQPGQTSRSAIAPASRTQDWAAPDPNPMLHAAADALSYGLLVFDSDARVLAHNSAASRLLTHGSLLTLTPIPGVPGGAMRIAGFDGATQASIEQAVHDCATPFAVSGLGIASPRPVRTLRLGRAAGERGVVLHLCPLQRSRATYQEGQPAVSGTLMDLGAPHRIETGRLMELFQLSASAARVAEAYLRADSVKGAARQLGISVNTVKTHLANVYERTGCSRQSQLVRLLMSLQ